MRYTEPEFLPWDGRRVPMTFVAGYLGAGKTTLINELLHRTDRPIAVLVNDVGEVNIDAALIRARSRTGGSETIELTDGCVCCSLNEGFGIALDQLRARPTPPDHVVVELSGVAEPGKVLPWARSAGFMLDGVVTVVDTTAIAELSTHPIVGHAIRSQIELADLCVLTHGDDLPATVEPMLPASTSVVRSQDPWLASALLELGGRRPGGAVDVPDATLFDAHEISTVALASPSTVAEVEALLDGLDDLERVVRAKGVFADLDDRLWLIQVVGNRRSIVPLTQAELQQTTDLVVIRLRRL